ncbi:pyridoxal phosphate-dependent transferase [Aspergillus karnatakaensis]|uniref:putative aminotransferase n=1 Tax=Aspergillus karnatakaensis TaxID=1810916 RepID=UPI003CCDB566
MVKIDTFEIDHWILTHSVGVKHNLAHSYCSAISIDELTALSENGASEDVNPLASLLSTPLKYGPMKGLETLRRQISNLYADDESSPVSIDNILPTPGGSLANFVALFALVGPGDHVIVQYPTYQQLYSLPAGVGAEVSLWKSKEHDGWKLDLVELKGLIQSNTKMIVINNPTNPTGAAIPRSALQEIVNIAREHSIIILSDEIYSPLFHSIDRADPELPPSILSFGYEHAVATSALSKAYSLAGLRIGWIASLSPEIIDVCLNARSYALITASQVDEHLAAYALSPPRVQGLLDRNFALSRRNLEIVQGFIDEHSSICQWARPVGGPIGFVQFTQSGQPVDDVELCSQLLRRQSLLLVPGSKCFGDGENFAGYVRLGFGNQTEELVAALDALRSFIREDYDRVPVL